MANFFGILMNDVKKSKVKKVRVIKIGGLPLRIENKVELDFGD